MVRVLGHVLGTGHDSECGSGCIDYLVDVVLTRGGL